MGPSWNGSDLTGLALECISANMAEANSEELEYHVTFPTAISTDPGGESSTNSGLPNTEPVVVLLGWLGCEDRLLNKYSAIYHSIGFTTIRYTVPRHAITNALKLKVIARKILELVYDLGLEDSVVFFHIFSNGGCFLYRYITQFLHNPTFGGGEFSQIKVGGCIFDSTPCPTNLLVSLKVGNRVDKTSGILMRIIKAIVFLLLTFLSLFLSPNHPWNVRQDQPSFITAMKTDPSRYPQLFLYSKADHICDWRVVESVVEARRQKHVEVQQVCWEDSHHCRHLLKHREDYIQNCQEFVKRCLQDYMDETSD